MLKRLAERKGTVFFVVPFVALAEEKLTYFQDIWQDMNIGVKAFHGEETTHTLTDDVDVAVCTIEKANILLTQLYDEGRAQQLSMVVVDEIHMLADSHRGFLLEVMLSKILHTSKSDSSDEGYKSVQIVGMSATLPNIADLSQWLGAELYTTAYRPVLLEVRVCVDQALYRVKKEEMPEPKSNIESCLKRLLSAERLHLMSVMGPSSGDSMETISGSSYSQGAAVLNEDSSHSINAAMHSTCRLSSSSAETPPSLELDRQLKGLHRNDPDGLSELCLETVRSRKSVLLFCNSKRRCEVCATNIAEAVSSSLAATPPNPTSSSSLFSAVLSTSNRHRTTATSVTNETKSLVHKYSGMESNRGLGHESYLVQLQSHQFLICR